MSQPAVSITHDEWIAAWREAIERRPVIRGDAGLTAVELSEALGLSATKVKRLLHDQEKAGVLVAGRSYRAAIDGILRPVSVYRVK